MLLRERFMSKVDQRGCWLWRGAVVEATGYGRAWSGRKVDYAHRVSWLLFRGEIPVGLYVCHRCDVRVCVNPDHLFLGTAKDNMQDASRKGRVRLPRESFCSDERHQVAKLTNAQVREIRASPLRPKELWRLGLYPVSYEAICMAKRGASFRGVR